MRNLVVAGLCVAQKSIAEIQYALTLRGVIVVKRNRLFWQMRKIARPQKVAQSCSRAAGIDVERAGPGDDVVIVHGPKINTVARDISLVRYRLVQLAAPKKE
jgi:hypothetical protein